MKQSELEKKIKKTRVYIVRARVHGDPKEVPDRQILLNLGSFRTIQQTDRVIYYFEDKDNDTVMMKKRPEFRGCFAEYGKHILKYIHNPKVVIVE